MIATTSPAVYLLALGAKTLLLIGLGRYGELLQIVRNARNLAEKNGEDPWVFIFREAWLRHLCFDFEGVRQLSEIMMRSDTEQHAAEPRAMAMVNSGYAELSMGRYEAALRYFAKVRDPGITPNFLFHWRWRMRAQLASVETRLQAGDLENARREVDDFLQSAVSIMEPNLQAFGWEASARVAMAQKNRDRAWQDIESALTILNKFDLPVVAWRVHATASDVYRDAQQEAKADGHREYAQKEIMRLADSFEPNEPLRASLLAAAPVRRIFQNPVPNL
jgi:tetratricopeptide (TPR) repeat protein